MNYFLHIDTTADIAIVAISCNGSLISSVVSNETRNHASAINIMVAEVLAGAGTSLQGLSAIVVCAGPGSYTGLRIGLSTAKGFCYALGIPLLMDNKLNLLALQAQGQLQKEYDYYMPVLKAREGEYFISIFNNEAGNIYEPQHITEATLDGLCEEKGNICVISTDFPHVLVTKYANSLYIVTDTEIRLDFWAFYAFEQYKCKNTVNLSTAEPFYLKQVYTHNKL